MNLSIISFTQNGKLLSQRIAKCLEKEDNEKERKPEVVLYTKCRLCKDMEADKNAAAVSFAETSIGEWTGKQMQEKKAILFIGACGIAVRAAAPFLTDKLHDAPVLVMDEKGKYCIPILSGHMGGANELALYLAKKIGAEPVITTATDINGAFAIDVFAKKNGLTIVEKDGIAKVSAKILAGEEITMSIEPGRRVNMADVADRKDMADTEEDAENGMFSRVRLVPYPPVEPVDVIVTAKEAAFDTALTLRPKNSASEAALTPCSKEYVIGIGCKKGKSADDIDALIKRKMEEFEISFLQIFAIASISQKREEPGIVTWCRQKNIPFFTYTAEELQAVEGNFKKSVFVERHVGVDNVCERAALKACGAGGELLCEKYAENGMTIAIAGREIVDAGKEIAVAGREQIPCKNRIYIVGMGPGREEMMTGEALAVLEEADVIIGYSVYLNLLGERFRKKELLATPMRQERERCRLCFEEAGKGKKTVLIGSGDAGIYGLASLMYEMGREYPETELFVIPGITAACGGAAILGAPLNHDFCVISLSDLLIPWEKIEKRLKAAAEGDFTIVLYNPSSHKRKDYLMRACGILLERIEGERVCGYVENIGRDGTKAEICTLEELKDREVNMFTTVFIGCSGSERINGKFITKRGYHV